jgi:uncharacterized delta-60 repeat protein
MSFSPATFRSVRRSLMALLPCLLIILSVLVGQTSIHAAAGEVDLSFQEAPLIGQGAYVNRIAVQADGKILIAGNFTTLDGVGRTAIARLNADGTLDTAFTTSTNAGSSVYAIALQADGDILIGGSFTAVNGISRRGIARLNADGTLDTTFNPYVNNDVYGFLTLTLPQCSNIVSAAGVRWYTRSTDYLWK